MLPDRYVHRRQLVLKFLLTPTPLHLSWDPPLGSFVCRPRVTTWLNSLLEPHVSGSPCVFTSCLLCMFHFFQSHSSVLTWYSAQRQRLRKLAGPFKKTLFRFPRSPSRPSLLILQVNILKFRASSCSSRLPSCSAGAVGGFQSSPEHLAGGEALPPLAAHNSQLVWRDASNRKAELKQQQAFFRVCWVEF